MYLKILEEIKKSEKYSPKTHPIITLNNSEIFEEYYKCKYSTKGSGNAGSISRTIYT